MNGSQAMVEENSQIEKDYEMLPKLGKGKITVKMRRMEVRNIQ